MKGHTYSMQLLYMMCLACLNVLLLLLYIISVFLIASIFTVIAIGVLDGTIIVYHPMTMTLSTSKLTLFVLNIFYLFIIFGLLIFHPSAFTNMCSLSH